MSDGRRLMIIAGPSGAGKDSCIDWCLKHLDSSRFVIRAHRYCTRPTGIGENFISLDQADFSRRLAIGAFALHWSANGLDYGIGIELDHWLAHGATVILNGSRGALADCLHRYPAATIVHISADVVVRAERLAKRGRESRQSIAERLRRDIPVIINGHHIHRIDNNYDLAHAGRQLCDLLMRQTGDEPVYAQCARSHL